MQHSPTSLFAADRQLHKTSSGQGAKLRVRHRSWNFAPNLPTTAPALILVTKHSTGIPTSREFSVPLADLS